MLCSAAFCILAIWGCENNLQDQRTTAPVLPAVPYKYSASFFSEDDKATLGRVLFYDKKLSLNNAIACASCHDQQHGFCDPKQFSTGFEGKQTTRNSPGFSGKSLRGSLFWDMRAPSLDSLILEPIQNHIEMGMEDLDKLESKLDEIGYYSQLFENAFGDDRITKERLAECMSLFLGSIEGEGSMFDQALRVSNETGDWEGLPPLEQEGFEIFERVGCASCHALDAFWTDAANIGLEMEYEDRGLGERTGNIREYGVFKVPDLRNVALTAPYMHDGRFETLEEVVEHYNSGVQPHPNLDWRLQDSDVELSMQDVLTRLAAIGISLSDVNQMSEDEIEAIMPLIGSGSPKKLGLNA